MSNTKPTILIVGAGPAGCTTALRLAKLGVKSILIDKAVFPRDKICGDALSGKVMDIVRKLNPDWIAEFQSCSKAIGSYGILFVSPSGYRLRLPFKPSYTAEEPAPGFVSKRVDFDDWLVNKVKQEPLIQLMEQTEVRHYTFDEENQTWQAQCKDVGTLTADFIVACDGAYSSFTKEVAGLSTEPQHNCFGLRTYYRNVSNMDRENFIELHFVDDFLPGYFWIFPLPNGEANVGAGIRADYLQQKNINLKKQFERVITEHPEFKERFKNAEIVNDVKLFGLPLGSKTRKLHGHHYLLAGDAAMLIDPFTGEGIGNAMISGFEAANTIVSCITQNDYSEKATIHYQSTIERKLSAELKLSAKLQQLANYPRLFNFVVKRTVKSKALSDTFSAMFYDVNIRAKLKNPMFYLELLFSSFK